MLCPPDSKVVNPLPSGYPFFFFTSTLWNSLFNSLRLPVKEILRFYIFPVVCGTQKPTVSYHEIGSFTLS